MNIDARIEQFKELCEQEPGNDMARFSLGGAYTQAGRFADAAEAYLEVLRGNENFSKAYQLAGASLMKRGTRRRRATCSRRGT
jgi:tetratricopeptide (TPR) repeat protein